MTGHTEHGGSAWPRIARCPGSVQMVRGIPDPSGEDAKEGRLAHAAAECCLKEGIDAARVVEAGYFFDVSDDGAPADHRQLPADFAPYVQQYLDLCRDLPGEHFVEQTLSFEPWVPGNKGTADHVAIDERTKTLTVTDLKFGRGVQVFAERNEQLLIYAIAVYEEHSMFYDIEQVVVRISQPRRGHFDEWSISAKELMEVWAPWYRETYELSLSEDAPLHAGEKQCGFCRYAPKCSEYARYLEQTVSADFDDFEEEAAAGIEVGDETGKPAPITVANAEDLTLADIARVLEARKAIEKFLDKAYARALEADARGDTVPGFKRVAGRSNRTWRDEEEAEQTLRSMRLKTDQIFNKKLRSPAQVEEEVGKRQRKKLDALIVKPAGNPILVPVSDPRPPLPTAEAELGAFEEEDDDLGL